MDALPIHFLLFNQMFYLVIKLFWPTYESLNKSFISSLTYFWVGFRKFCWNILPGQTIWMKLQKQIILLLWPCFFWISFSFFIQIRFKNFQILTPSLFFKLCHRFSWRLMGFILSFINGLKDLRKLNIEWKNTP